MYSNNAWQSPPILKLFNDEENPFPSNNCDYFDFSSLYDEISCYNKNYFSIFCMNVRSCRKNFPSVLSFLNVLNHKFTIIILVETWLMADNDFTFYIPGYKNINIYKSNFSGGIKVFYLDYLNVEVLNELTIVNDTMQVLTFNLKGPTYSYILVTIYKPPSSNYRIFHDEFFGSVIENIPPNSKILIAGDLNLNLLNPLALPHIDEFVSCMLGFGYFPIITRQAKINPENPITKYSIIDQIWSNFLEGCNHRTGIVTWELTDHFPMFYVFNIASLYTCKAIKYRLVNENNVNAMINIVENSNLDYIFHISDPNEAFDEFYSQLKSNYDSFCPVIGKKIKQNSVNAPWVTPKLKKCIKKKFLLYNLFKRGVLDKRSFVWYKNLLKWATNKIRRLYYQNKLYSCMKNGKKTWENINTLLNRKKHDMVSKLITDDGQVLEGQEMANYFNSYFTSIASILTHDLPIENNYSYIELYIRPVPHSFYFIPTNMYEVQNILNGLPNKGNQLYDIRANILVRSKKIMKIIVYIYNLCIENGTYPELPKLARTIPVYKSGVSERANNYRPISNLSTINKVFEILTFNRMNTFVDKNKIISDCQYGFRKGKSTTQAIFHLVSDFLQCFNQKSYTIAVFLDLRKAFDTVNKDILVYKLNLLGFRGISNDFLNSYMSNRKQYADVGDYISDTMDINVGLPQGTVLGPLFFNIFINDITIAIDSKKVLFADDGVFYITESTLELCIEKVNVVLSQLTEYLSNNKLIPNTDKTKIMLITARHISDLPDIYFNGSKLEWVTNIRYLGIQLDNKLNFTLQSMEVCRRVSQLHGVIYSLATLVPQKTLLTIYNSLVYPILIQNILIWGGITENNLKPIKIKVNNILRIILNIKSDENNIPLMSTNEMYKRLNLLKFDDIYKFYLLKFLHFAFYKNSSIFLRFFAPLFPQHFYNTRQRRINLPSIRLEIERNSVIFRCCSLLNNLPENLVEPQSDGALRAKYKKLCIMNY